MPSSTMTIEETGWKRLGGHTMQWVAGRVEAGGRDVLRVLGGHLQDDADVLILRVGNLGEDDDPADSEAITDALGHGAECAIPRPAVAVLYAMLGSYLRATASPEE